MINDHNVLLLIAYLCLCVFSPQKVVNDHLSMIIMCYWQYMCSPQQRKKLVSDQKKRAKEAGPLQATGLEPSQKWKALGVSSEFSTARQMSPAKPRCE